VFYLLHGGDVHTHLLELRHLLLQEDDREVDCVAAH
jgi:hypothetical protein